MCHRHQKFLLLTIAIMSTTFSAIPAGAAENKGQAGAPGPAWATAGRADSQVQPVADQDAKKWLRWVIPLPKRVRLAGKLVLPASDIEMRLRSGATDVEQTARDELLGLIRKKTGVEQLDGPFLILIGVCDAQGKIDGVAVPGAERLRGLKNDDQAYVIAPLPARGLAVTGLTERGVYHGVKTLQQLLEPGLIKGQVTLPVVAVLDWPDLAERGEWEFDDLDAKRVVQYLADRKLNLLEVRTIRAFDDNGRGVPKTDLEGHKNARLHAVKWVPFISHLNNLGDRTEIYKLYPHLEGQGPRARHPQHPNLVAPCASHPQFAQVLAEWLMSAGAEGVTDVNIFLTELEGGMQQCECDRCKGTSQFVLEAVACVRAWQIAREKYPQLRLRILLSQGSYDVNDQVLAAVTQPEVGITYYSGRTTYDSSRDPMIYPLMADFAKRGRWLGCYPTLTAAHRVACPWSGPQFIKFRMTEFVDKGLVCMCGFAPSDNRFFDFNVTVAAEWSWNAHGRTEREFAAAWATRRGMTDPEKAADWAVMLGPVGWDVYGSKVPHNYFFGSAAAMVAKRRKPTLGKGMFRYFPAIKQMDDDLAVCEKALKLAEQLNDPALIGETRVIQGYVQIIKSIYVIADAVAGKKTLDEAQTRLLQDAFDALQAAGRQTTDALSAWANAVVPGYDVVGNRDAAGVTRQTVTDIGDALAPFGIKQVIASPISCEE